MKIAQERRTERVNMGNDALSVVPESLCFVKETRSFATKNSIKLSCNKTILCREQSRSAEYLVLGASSNSTNILHKSVLQSHSNKLLTHVRY